MWPDDLEPPENYTPGRTVFIIRKDGSWKLVKHEPPSHPDYADAKVKDCIRALVRMLAAHDVEEYLLKKEKVSTDTMANNNDQQQPESQKDET